MKISDRFLAYTLYDTQSDAHSSTCPSTSGQLYMARELADELEMIGMQDVVCDKNGYVMATLPASKGYKETPTVGFIAHMDTSPDLSGENVKARIVSYSGESIVLNEALHIILSPDAFPELNRYIGQELIVTDGTTLLGADDKAGVAAIVSAMEFFLEHPEIKHPKIRVAFTPDEEIGRGADRFDVNLFGCDWAYTVDGGEIGEIEYENFNAAEATIIIKGQNVHPGYAKGKMINAIQLGMELNALLPITQRPELTSGYEGFYHLTQFSGTVEEASMTYIIRDHDYKLFEEKKQLLQAKINQLNEIYANSLTVKITDQYYNMYEVLKSHMEIVELACQAMKAVGVEPRIRPIRGGTDGARLSFMRLPCPNLFSGGLNFHSRYEFLPVRSLEKSMETIIEIIKRI